MFYNTKRLEGIVSAKIIFTTFHEGVLSVVFIRIFWLQNPVSKGAAIKNAEAKITI
ncbi:MAG: hypothetical protein Q4C96_10110 [Planctomycetia bacterium]|nr:hypothetical protein [Planctomycetia bacterium]